MKKSIVRFVLTAAGALVFFACSEDDKEARKKTENPLYGFLAQAGFTETSSRIGAERFEFGISFKPLIAGRIKSFTVKIPGNNPAGINVFVTLWDATTKSVLTSATIPSVLPDVETVYPITPIELVKNKEYMITFNPGNYYIKESPTTGAVAYPMTVGNIIITAYGDIQGSTQAYPINFPDDYYVGDLGFEFEN